MNCTMDLWQLSGCVSISVMTTIVVFGVGRILKAALLRRMGGE